VLDLIVDYEATKVTSEGEAFHGAMREAQPELVAQIKGWAGAAPWTKRWTIERNKVAQEDADDHPNGKLELHFDALASGEKVVADTKHADALRAFQRKVIAIEMEAHGFSAACVRRHVPFLVVKAITDYANDTKNDDFHDFACQVASDLVAELVEDGIL
jgi:nucleoside phosphorylase